MTGIADLRRSAVLSGAAAPAAIVRCALPDDAPAITALYRAVQFCPSGLLSLHHFSMRGGMFEIPSQPQIERECAVSVNHFSLAERGGHLEALMRVSEDVSEYDGLSQRFEGALSYVELVVRSRQQHFVYPFLSANFETIERAGWQGLLFQIYHLIWLRVSGVQTELHIDNRASVNLHTKLGANRIGALADKHITLEDWELCIRPDVYYLPLHTANLRLTELCRRMGWRWTDVEA